ncbi:MAG TPA: RimK family protein [Bacteroidales bacterium]|nr:RimK family protein [Bacteroidales bacterium]HOR82420.1 RimK family protein [Bacteroidales bacterium]HPJ91660.1 RimK family protein [Bacteroidales bacterium]
MQHVLILLDDLKEWSPFYKTNTILSVSDYLQNKSKNTNSNLVINLSANFNYNSEGYYCSLLAQARGDRIIPSVETINRLESGTGIRMDNTLHKQCHQWIQKNNITDDVWYINIYFGTCEEKGLEKIARYIFDYYPCPILRVGFYNKSRNQVESVQAISLNSLTEQEQDIFANALDNFNKKIWRSPRSPKSYRYNLAIFHDPQEEFPSSDKKALYKFLEVAKKMNIHAELITEEDATRLMEFDALFIRSTTALNHITYNLSQRAKQADMVVIDDPLSIIRCTNKVYLNELLKKEKIPAPQSMLLFRSNKNSFTAIARQLGTPFILKIPDGSFSHDMHKINNEKELNVSLEVLFEKSAILLAQEYIPTDFDWRIGVLEHKPLFACKYFMAKNHWQIYNHEKQGKGKTGGFETVPIYKVPKNVIKTALKVTSYIGDGLYGVDLKMIDDKVVVIEVNDNPSIDHEVEDAILGDELYYRILNYFSKALENRF